MKNKEPQFDLSGQDSPKGELSSDNTFSQIVHANAIATFVINEQHVITHWNKACENLTGISAADTIGTKNQWKSFYRSPRPVMADMIVNRASGRQIAEQYGNRSRPSRIIQGAYEAEDFFPALGEEGKWVFFTASPLKDDAGRVVGAIETLQDISDRKRAERNLEQTVSRLNERVKELDCFFSISRIAEKRDVSLEETFREIVGIIPPAMQYPDKMCASITFQGNKYTTPGYRETQWTQVVPIVVNGRHCGQLQVCCREQRPGPDKGETFLVEEKNLIHSIAEGLARIAERKIAMEALQKSEKNFSDLVQHLLIGILIIQNGRIVFRNPEIDRLFGPLPDSGKLSDLDIIYPDDIEKLSGFYQKVFTGDIPDAEIDFRYHLPEGSRQTPTMRWVHCRASPINYQGKDATLFNVMDMTHARELEHLLRVHDKMTSLGRVAAGIAHEIRNPLSGINIYLETLQKLYASGEHEEKAGSIFEKIKSASAQIESIIKRVMDFSRPGKLQFVMTDINHSIGEAINLSATMLRKNGIKLEKKLSPRLPACLADPNQIEEVVLNFLTNAAESLRETEKKLICITSYVHNDSIMITVSDSGSGIPPHYRDKVFDPFFTTKNYSAGIGLSISRRIIIDHGGSIDIQESSLGGVAFIVSLPIRKELPHR